MTSLFFFLSKCAFQSRVSLARGSASFLLARSVLPRRRAGSFHSTQSGDAFAQSINAGFVFGLVHADFVARQNCGGHPVGLRSGTP